MPLNTLKIQSDLFLQLLNAALRLPADLLRLPADLRLPASAHATIIEPWWRRTRCLAWRSLVARPRLLGMLPGASTTAGEVEAGGGAQSE